MRLPENESAISMLIQYIGDNYFEPRKNWSPDIFEEHKLLVCGGFNREQKYLVDELQMMLSQMNVETATVDANCIESIGEDI